MKFRCLILGHKWENIKNSKGHWLLDRNKKPICDRMCLRCGKLDDRVSRFIVGFKERQCEIILV